jgi:WD40 repeat protein
MLDYYLRNHYYTLLSRLVTGSTDHSVRVWNLATGAGLCTLLGHNGPVCCVAIDDATIVSGGDDLTVHCRGRNIITYTFYSVVE